MKKYKRWNELGHEEHIAVIALITGLVVACLFGYLGIINFIKALT